MRKKNPYAMYAGQSQIAYNDWLLFNKAERAWANCALDLALYGPDQSVVAGGAEPVGLTQLYQLPEDGSPVTALERAWEAARLQQVGWNRGQPQ